MAGRTGPGPGNYMLPPTVGYEKHDITRKRNPAYSIGVKTPVCLRKPGPGPYGLKQNQTRFGNTYSPAYSIAGRIVALARDKVPGPGTYAPEKCPPMKERRPPAYSMGIRSDLYKASRSPGPNQYSLPTTVGKGPGYSMGGRLGALREMQSPGPAQYNPPNLNVYKPKAPQVTLIGRTPGVSDKSRNPGPAAYKPGSIPSSCQGKVTFGIKHSENSQPLILKEDNF